MKIKIELYLPFQKLEQYNIETDLDDIIQALPNSDINKQDALDSILKYGLYDCLPEQMEFKEGEYILNFQVDNKIHQNTHHLLMCLIDQLSEKEADGYSLSLRKNKSAETILTHPIYSPKEITTSDSSPIRSLINWFCRSSIILYSSADSVYRFDSGKL